MSREYSKISPKLWRSPRFRGLESPDARMLYVYLLTCEHQSSAGCFRLPDAYAASDLNWNTDRLGAARPLLIACGLVVYDQRTDEYFIPRWFRHNPTTNSKHRQGVQRLICSLDSDSVREAAETELSEHEESKNTLGSGPIPLSSANDRLARSQYISNRKGA